MLPTDQQPIATCTSYVFPHATTVSLIDLIFYMNNKNRRFEASAHNQQNELILLIFRKCYVPRRINVTILVWYYLSSRPEVFCEKAVLRNFPKLTRLVFSWFLGLLGNFHIVKENPTRKTCFSHEKKRLAPRIYRAKFCLAAFL